MLFSTGLPNFNVIKSWLLNSKYSRVTCNRSEHEDTCYRFKISHFGYSKLEHEEAVNLLNGSRMNRPVASVNAA